MEISRIITSAPAASAQWSVVITAGERKFSHNSQLELQTASVAKIFVLIELACQIDAGVFSPTEKVSRDSTFAVSDSGLWQHLDNSELTVNDAARLVGTCSDNWAVNVLIERLGLTSIQERAASLCATRTTLHDYVRDDRRPPAPTTLSTGTAADWASIMQGLSRGEIVNHGVSMCVMDWLSTCMDLSMVPGDFGLDPLSHGTSSGADLTLICKTGTDSGVRADTGIISKSGNVLTYAALCNWDPASDLEAIDILQTMCKIGAAAVELL